MLEIQSTFSSILQLQNLQLALSDISPMMMQIGDYMTGYVESEFSSRIDPYGIPWQPLSPATVKRETKRQQAAMLRSLKIVVGSSAVTISLDSPAGFLQTGTKRMHSRKIFPDSGLPPNLENALTSIASNYLESRMNLK